MNNEKNNKNRMDVPKNINNFRQIINKNSNVGNLNWVYKLRKCEKIERSYNKSNSVPFKCYNKETASSKNRIKKDNLLRPKINNKTSHLIKRRPGGEISHNQISFETNLRIFRKLKTKKLYTNNLYYNYKIKNSEGIPIQLKEELKLKKDIDRELKKIENIKNIKEKLKLIKNLPNLKKNYIDSKENNLFEKSAKINNITSHLVKKRPDGNASLTQIKFETNLRSNDKNKTNNINTENISKKLYYNYSLKNLWKGLPIKYKDEIRIKKEINNELKEIEKIKNFKERLKRIKNLPQLKKLI